ncbi:hypothetical protein ACI3L1_18120, partial [Deinococcus sp. SM5_A1]|uniref:hypothetical protein n=1 Tax=Deinococcus sp. SM5_A1 TaxID=3379094 RepID=UPI00385ACAB8
MTTMLAGHNNWILASQICHRRKKPGKRRFVNSTPGTRFSPARVCPDFLVFLTSGARGSKTSKKQRQVMGRDFPAD